MLLKFGDWMEERLDGVPFGRRSLPEKSLK